MKGSRNIIIFQLSLLFLLFLLIITSITKSTVHALTTTPTSMKKRILVTGGNKGIGKSICARLLLEWKDTYVIMGSRNLERGKDAIAELKEQYSLEKKCDMDDDRLHLVQIDTSNEESVKAAAETLFPNSNNNDDDTTKLYGIINNAGIMSRDETYSLKDVINVNYFGPRRVNDVFEKYLTKKGSRIVNIASAGGPNFVSRLDGTNNELKSKLGKPWTIQGGIQELDDIANSITDVDNNYGFSKALLNAYTVIHARQSSSKDIIIINSCSPGWIQTDMTKGSAASGTPEKGAIPPCWLMMDEEFIPKEPTGRYYGSDCIRSPLNVYRGPGDEPYINDDDLVV